MDITDPETLVAATKYFRRAYPDRPDTDVQTTNWTEFDVKMIRTMVKLKSSYKSHADSRKVPKYHHERVTLEKRDTSAAEVVDHRCPAVKRDGKVCDAKLKDGLEFCKRHLKKNT